MGQSYFLKRRTSTLPGVNILQITARRALGSGEKKKIQRPFKSQNSTLNMRQNGHYVASFPFISLPYSGVYDCQRHRERERNGDTWKKQRESERERQKANAQQREKSVGPIKILSRHQSCWSGKCTLQSWPLNALHYECWVLPWWWPGGESLLLGSLHSHPTRKRFVNDLPIVVGLCP